MTTKSTIYLRLTNGKGQRVKIFLNEPIASLQRSVKKLLKGTVDSYELFFKGAFLDQHSSDSLSAAGITEDCIIHVVQQISKKKHQITVKVMVDHKKYSFDVQTAETIKKLKDILGRELNLDADDIFLSYLGIEMEDSKRVEDYRVEDNALLSAFIVKNFKESKIIKHTHIKHLNEQMAEKERLQGQNKVIEHEINLLFNNDPSSPQSNGLLKAFMIDKKIVETKSVMDDDIFNEVDCFIEVTRVDRQREYLFSCKNNSTFQEVKKLVGVMDNVPEGKIRLKMNTELVENESKLLFTNKATQKSSYMSNSFQEEGKDSVVEIFECKGSLDDGWEKYGDKIASQVYQSEFVEDGIASTLGLRQNAKTIVLEYEVL